MTHPKYFANLFASIRMIIVLAVVLFGFLTASAQGDFESLFNGKDLSNWKGAPGLWKVEDGMIVGSSVGTEIDNNTFLIYTGGVVQNFHLKAKLRMTGDNNSGIQYRSQPIEDLALALKGPQMDIHPRLEYQGMYYSEKTGRGIIVQRGHKALVPAERNKDGKTTPQIKRDLGKEPHFDLAQWNEYEVIAVGRRIIHKINGVVTIDVRDLDPSFDLKGVIGFQLHRGAEMTVYIKDVELKHLKGREGRKAIQAALGD